LSESLVEGAGWVAFPLESAAPDSFRPLAVSADVPFTPVSADRPLLVSLTEPVSVPAPPVVLPASWLRSRPLQPARTIATRPAPACEVHRMGDTLSSEAFPMLGTFPILHPRGERKGQGLK
jgi:hypothetical protein